MIVVAHIFGIPVEEFMTPWISAAVCAGALTVVASNVGSFLRRQRREK